MTIDDVRQLLQVRFPDRTIRVFQGNLNLHEITVCHDFPWTDLVPHGKRMFSHGLSLAAYAFDYKPKGLIPVLYLSATEKRPSSFEIENLWLLVVPMELYLQTANPDPATSFFAYHAKAPVIDLVNITPSSFLSGESGVLLEKLWAGDHTQEELIDTLKKLVGPSEQQEDEPVTANHASLAIALLSFVARSPDAIGLLTSALKTEENVPDLDSVMEVISARGRREAVDEFAERLSMTGSEGKWTEGQWEDFFRKNPWLLGLNLKECVFLKELQGQPYYGGKDLTNTGGQEGDSLMASVGEVLFTTCVELKTPEAPLVDPTKYREKTYAPSKSLAGCVSQVLTQCYRWEAGVEMSEHRTELRFKRTYTVRTQGIVVIGNLASILDDNDKVMSFELFRNSLHGIRVATFDELLARAKALLG